LARGELITSSRWSAWTSWKFSPRVVTFIFIALVAFLVWTQVYSTLGNGFSPDSYSYFMLGHNFLTGHGFTSNAINDLAAPAVFPSVSRSFPPLYPILVGLLDRLVGLGLLSGVYLNGLIVLLTAWAFAALCRIISPERWMQLLLVLPIYILCSHDYQDELVAGRPIPLIALFYFVLAIVFLKSIGNDRVRTGFCILSGLLLAAMTLARFDQMIFAFGFPFVAFVVYRISGLKTRESARAAVVVAASFALFYSPWAIRNYLQFGHLFSSNNTVTVLSTEAGILHLFFWKAGGVAPTIFQAPGLWLSERLSYLLRDLLDVLKTSRGLLVLVPALLGIYYKRLSRSELVFTTITAAFILANFMTVSMTPLEDSRYFCLSILMLFVLFFMLVTGPVLSQVPLAKKPVLLIAVVYILFVGAPAVRDASSDVVANGLRPIPQSSIARQVYFDRMHSDLLRAASQTNPAVTDPIVAINYADVFTYYTGLRSLYPLRNASTWDENMKAWAEKWKPDFIIAPQEWVTSHGLDKALVGKSVDDLEILDVRKLATSPILGASDR